MRALVGLVGAAALAFTVACAQTDAGITTNVKSKMAADDMVKAYQVDVTTQNHVVTLSGEVESTAARDRAIEIARATDGVTDVIDQLLVAETAPTSGVDVDIDDDIEDAASRSADAVVDGAKKGAEAVKEGAKKTGEAVRDAVTDDDRDSDKDGK